MPFVLTRACLKHDNEINSNVDVRDYKLMKHVKKTMSNLSRLGTGEAAHITGIHAPDDIRQRLQAMGLRTGREAQVIRCTRLGPMQIRVGSVDLIMRRCDAARVEIAACSAARIDIVSKK